MVASCVKGTLDLSRIVRWNTMRSCKDYMYLASLHISFVLIGKALPALLPPSQLATFPTPLPSAHHISDTVDLAWPVYIRFYFSGTVHLEKRDLHERVFIAILNVVILQAINRCQFGISHFMNESLIHIRSIPLQYICIVSNLICMWDMGQSLKCLLALAWFLRVSVSLPKDR